MTISHYLLRKLLILSLLILTSTVASAALVKVDFTLPAYAWYDSMLGIGDDTYFTVTGSFTYDTASQGTQNPSGWRFDDALRSFTVQLGDDQLSLDLDTLSMSYGGSNSSLEWFHITSASGHWTGSFISGPLTGTQIVHVCCNGTVAPKLRLSINSQPVIAIGLDTIVLPENYFASASFAISTQDFQVNSDLIFPERDFYNVSSVPLPGSVILLISGLVTLFGLNSRRRGIVKA